MSAGRERREPAHFRFDPHRGGGGPLGLGVTRSVVLGGVLAVGVLCLYEGQPVTAALLLTLAAPVVLARWQGLPLLVWLVLRAGYRLAGPRRWEVDPELVGMSQPIARGGSDGR
ncbi:MAG TPA: hypothetical protein VFY45_03205 [Baekduia sp.]|nr:hypothetical protein [Baekduia sp.]